MSRTQSQIIARIQNLCVQYKAEVPGPNQAWPKSIKVRVAELHALGLGDSEVAQQVPIPMQTIYSWRHVARKKQKAQGPSFIPVKVLADSSTATAKNLSVGTDCSSISINPVNSLRC